MDRELHPPPRNQQEQLKYSVSTRVLVALSVIILAFGSLVSYSVLLYRRSVAELDLITTTFTQLALGTSEIESAQMVFSTLMDRLADEPNHPLTRDWLNAARKYRPVTLTRLIALIGDKLEENPGMPEGEKAFLIETRERLRDVRRRYRLNENKFAELFSSIETGQLTPITQKLEKLKRSERLLNKVLSGIGDDVRTHMKSVSKEAVGNGNTTTIALAVMLSLALLTGVALIFSTRKILFPLKSLQMAVSKVASGDFNTHINIERNDEIGLLATNFNHMTDALNERDAKLIRQERLATAGRIAAQVTHEIRNPLSSLDLNADLLRDEIGPDGSLEESLQLLGAMQDEIERLTNITEAYLSFARLPSPSPGSHDLNKTISDVAEFLTPELISMHLSLEVSTAPGKLKAYFDKEQIRQVLINLVRNSMQALENRGKITITSQERKKEVSFSVMDNGPGIPEEMQPSIFDPFFTTKSTGTGLGLAIVRQICLAHSGKISYTNSSSGGAEFTVTLPSSFKSRTPGHTWNE